MHVLCEYEGKRSRIAGGKRMLLPVWATFSPSLRLQAVYRHIVLSDWHAVFTFVYLWTTAISFLDFALFELELLEKFREVV